MVQVYCCNPRGWLAHHNSPFPSLRFPPSTAASPGSHACLCSSLAFSFHCILRPSSQPAYIHTYVHTYIHRQPVITHSLIVTQPSTATAPASLATRSRCCSSIYPSVACTTSLGTCILPPGTRSTLCDAGK